MAIITWLALMIILCGAPQDAYLFPRATWVQEEEGRDKHRHCKHPRCQICRPHQPIDR